MDFSFYFSRFKLNFMISYLFSWVRQCCKMGLLTLLLVLGISINSFSQDKKLPVISVSGYRGDGVKAVPASKIKIMTDPVLRCPDHDCQIVSCDVSFKFKNGSTGKKGQYYGPFSSKGNSIPDKVLQLMKEFSGGEVTLYFDDIHVILNGQEVSATPVFLTYSD